MADEIGPVIGKGPFSSPREHGPDLTRPQSPEVGATLKSGPYSETRKKHGPDLTSVPNRRGRGQHF
jgi:hypothetical protein